MVKTERTKFCLVSFRRERDDVKIENYDMGKKKFSDFKVDFHRLWA